MIFVTVGAQMPFDRLVRTVDEWAGGQPDANVFAQVGPGGYQPCNGEWTEFLAPPAFRARVQAASILIAHAGMGSILTALEHGKPLLIMPRRGDLRETRNDHQIATAARFRELGRVAVAMDEHELRGRLQRLDELEAGVQISPHASPELLSALRAFIMDSD